MNITADAVKQLRERTGAGMMECKKALVETKGDLDAAAELMRKSGLAKADKKATRIAAEGTVVVERAGHRRRAGRGQLRNRFRRPRATNSRRSRAPWPVRRSPARRPTSRRCSRLPHAGGTLDDRRRALIAKIGENIAVRRFVRVTAPTALGAYLHGRRIGALVALKGGDEALAHDIAMHVAAVNPAYVDAGGVPAAVLDKEREILTEQTKGEKQAARRSSPRWSRAGCASILAEITLARPAVRQGSGCHGREAAEERQAPRWPQFVRYEVGAGIEKKQDDFVGEVMAQVKSRTRRPVRSTDAGRRSRKTPHRRGVFSSRVVTI